MTATIALVVADAEATAINTQIGSNPQLKIYAGTKPATPETAATGTLVDTIPLTGFTVDGDVLTSNDPAAVNPVVAASAPLYARLVTSSGTDIMDLDVSDETGNGDVKLATTTIQTAVPIDITAITINLGGS